MKIAIPSEGKELDSAVCQSFGRTTYFILVDTDTQNYTVLNNEAAVAQGGAGIKAAQSIVDRGAKAVVTFHCGENAANVLKAANIKILKAVPATVKEIIDKYKNDELSELTEINAGYHGSGNQ